MKNCNFCAYHTPNTGETEACEELVEIKTRHNVLKLPFVEKFSLLKTTRTLHQSASRCKGLGRVSWIDRNDIYHKKEVKKADYRAKIDYRKVFCAEISIQQFQMKRSYNVQRR